MHSIITSLPPLNKIQNKTILIIGDLMLDEYHWCDVERISPEAPIPICNVNHTTLVPGGAGNVARNIQRLNNSAILIGTIGNDSSGDKLTQTLQKHAINTDHLIQGSDRPTILKSRVIAQNQHVIRIDRESTKPITRENETLVINKAQQLLPDIHAIILSDYGKGTLSNNVLQKIIKMGYTSNIPVIIDPKGSDYKKYKGATVITPNFSEFQLAVNKDISSESKIFQAGKALKTKLDISTLLITRSEKGMSLIDKSNSKVDIPTQAKDIYDITGAGDTVIATFTCALAAGWSPEQAAHIANLSAGIVVGKVGASDVTIDEIQDILNRQKDPNG